MCMCVCVDRWIDRCCDAYGAYILYLAITQMDGKGFVIVTVDVDVDMYSDR